MRVTIEAKTAKVVQALGKFGSALKKELAVGITAAASGMKADTTKELKKQYQVDVAKSTAKYSRDKATASKLESTLTIRGRMEPVFKLGQPTPSRVMGGKTSGGVSVMIKGQRKTYPSAFVARMTEGFYKKERLRGTKYFGQAVRGGAVDHIGVFKRKEEKGRLPIKEIYEPSIPQQTEDEPIIEPAINKVLPKMINGVHRALNHLKKNWGTK